MKKNWYWFIPIIVAFIVGYFLKGVMPAVAVGNTAGYDIFRDLLTIFLALLLGVGALLYLVIRKEVVEKVRDDIRKEFSRINAKMNINVGLMYFYQGIYEEAIKETKKALREENTEEIDKIWAKNNLAYYYAADHTGYHPYKEVKEHSQPENKKEAIRLADYVYEEYDPLVDKYNKSAWVETCAFVKARFAETPEEKKEARKFIHALLPRRDLQSRKKELEQSLDFLST